MRVSLRSQFLLLVVPFIGALVALLVAVLAPYFAVRGDLVEIERELQLTLRLQAVADTFMAQTREYADFIVTMSPGDARQARDAAELCRRELVVLGQLEQQDRRDGLAVSGPMTIEQGRMTELGERVVTLRQEGRRAEAAKLLDELLPAATESTQRLDRALRIHHDSIMKRIARIRGGIGYARGLPFGRMVKRIEDLDCHVAEVLESAAYKRAIEREVRGYWMFFLGGDHRRDEVMSDHERVTTAFAAWRRAVQSYSGTNVYGGITQTNELAFVDARQRDYLALHTKGLQMVHWVDAGSTDRALELLETALEFDRTPIANALEQYLDDEIDVVIRSFADLRNEARRAEFIVLTAGSVVLLLGLAIPWRLARRMIRPIMELERAALRIGRGDLETRTDVPETAELARLANTFNEMARELKVARSEDLRKSEERFKLAARSSNDMLWDWNVTTDELWVDRGFRAQFGLGDEEIVPNGLWSEAVHPDDRDRVRKSLDDVASGSAEFWAAEYRFRRVDGTYSQMSDRGYIVRDPNGQAVRMIGALADITEKHEVDRLKSQFVATVSHELRTPLTSIRGALGLLAKGLLGELSAKGQRMLDVAVSNTDRLVRLINDILDVERMDSGAMAMTRTEVDVLELMSRAAEGVQSMADGAGVGLVIEPIEASLFADSDRLQQALTNLLGNAIKFSPSQTTVTLAAYLADSVCTFRVADEGRGVPETKREMIFERFQQVDASDSRDKGGSGLGLAICRSIVTAHGGRIWVEPNEPAGTVFQFTIP